MSGIYTRVRPTWAQWYRDDAKAAVALAAVMRARGHAVVMQQGHVLVTRAPAGIEHGWHVRDVGPHAPWHVYRAALLSMLEWRGAADGRVAWLAHVAMHADAPRRGVFACDVDAWADAARRWDSTCEPMMIDVLAWRRVDDVC